MPQIIYWVKIGWPYRKRKRKCAHHILEILCKHKNLLLNPPLGDFYSPKRYESLSVLEISEKDKKYYLIEYEEAIKLLLTNEHVRYPRILDNPRSEPISPTEKGLEAYYQGYYFVENRKDWLEHVELKTKWILPIFAFVISLFALGVAIYAASKK